MGRKSCKVAIQRLWQSCKLGFSHPAGAALTMPVNPLMLAPH